MISIKRPILGNISLRRTVEQYDNVNGTDLETPTVFRNKMNLK